MDSQSNNSSHFLQEHSSIDGGIKPISLDDFADKFTAPVKPAVAPAGADASRSTTQPEETVIPGADKEEPIFKPQEPADDEPITIKKWTKEEREVIQGNLEMMLNARSIYLAEAGSWISGEPAEKYELSEEEMNRLARVYSPYMKKWGGQIPDWVWLLLAEGMITGKFIKTVMSDRKVNKTNAQLAGSAGVHQASTIATAAQTGKRKNYSLDSDGWYLMDAITNQRLTKAVRQAKPKPSIEDLLRILEDNEESTVRAIYPNWFVSNA